MTHPNILLIHWHDLGRHLGSYGAGWVDSPHLDMLAEQGTRFDQAYCAGPLCSPARGALMTGRYPHSNGLMGLAHLGWEYAPGERTMAHYLHDAGYRTALIGLQHESRDPRRLGYDEVHEARRPGEAQFCGLVADRATAWLEAAGRHQQPFFASVGFFEVHRPYPSDRYPPDDPRTVDVPSWLTDNPYVRADMAGLQSAIRTADAAVGRILAALQRSGLDENTWVIFTTDHGLALPRAKSTLYDSGTGVAWIQRLPPSWRLEEGPTDRLVSHVDLVPTILDAIGAGIPAAVQGTSQLSWLRDRTVPERPEIFTEKTFHDAYDPIRALRTRTHKFIRNFEERPAVLLSRDVERSLSRFGYGDEHLRHRAPLELYDLRTDPCETTNLAGSPEHASTVENLSDSLLAWQVRTHDPLLAGPVPGVAYPLT